MPALLVSDPVIPRRDGELPCGTTTVQHAICSSCGDMRARVSDLVDRFGHTRTQGQTLSRTEADRWKKTREIQRLVVTFTETTKAKP